MQPCRIYHNLDFTCYIRPRLALLYIELKRLTVVLNSVHNPMRDTNQCYIISDRFKTGHI